MLVAGLGNTLGNLLERHRTDAEAQPSPASGALDRLAAAVETSAPAEAPSAPPKPRRRAAARSPRNPAPLPAEPAPAPAAPRLMRRAEVTHAEPAIPELLQAPPEARRRGIVRWFDARTGRGMLRIPGFAEDVALDPQMLQRAGLSRLYKGQEIEALVTGENGHSRLVSVALPGQPAAAKGGLKVGGMRRHAKPVVVEMKRDALRRAAARVEAEHVLGSAPHHRKFGSD